MAALVVFNARPGGNIANAKRRDATRADDITLQCHLPIIFNSTLDFKNLVSEKALDKGTESPRSESRYARDVACLTTYPFRVFGMKARRKRSATGPMPGEDFSLGPATLRMRMSCSCAESQARIFGGCPASAESQISKCFL